MKIVIDIPKKTYEELKTRKVINAGETFSQKLIKYIRNGTPLPNSCNIVEQKWKAQPEIGRWISHSEHCEMNNLRPSGLGCYFWCSKCDCGIDYKYFHMVNHNYCPYCGAKMQEEEENDD